MVRLNKRGKRVLAGAFVLVLGFTGAKVIGSLSSPQVSIVEEMPVLNELPATLVTAEEGVQVEPILTRNDNCAFTRETAIYIDDDTASKRLVNVNINDNCYRLFSTNTQFSLVRYGKYIGYVPTNSLESLSVNENDSISYGEAQGLGMINASEVNFRTGADTKFDSYGYVNLNDGLELLAESNNGWYLVRRTGLFGDEKLGFVSKKYVDEVSESEYSSRLPYFVSAVVSTADDYVNIRALNNTDSEILGRLNHGKSLPMLGIEDNGWYAVQMEDGRTGYVSGQYAKQTYIVKNMDSYKAVGMTTDTFLYNRPGGDVVGSLPKYEVGVVFREDNGFYLIRTYDGEIAYVSKKDTSVLTPVCIIADISDQKAYVIKDGHLILTTNICTGKKGTESNIGFGRLQCHERSTPGHQIYLEDQAKTYKTPVTYWMRIEWYNEATGKWYTNGQGFHDLKGTRYDGVPKSHGCFRTQKAEELFDLTDVGVSVLSKR